MHNPLRSEAEAFRWLVVIGAAAASVIAVALLIRPALGVAWGLVLIAIGVGLAWRSSRGSLPRSLGGRRGIDDRHRLLVVADQTVGGRALLREIRERAGGADSEILVITPALASSGGARRSPELDEAIELARQRLELCLQALQEAGLRARGRVGDSDPNRAIEDALAEFAADEVIVVDLEVETAPPR